MKKILAILFTLSIMLLIACNNDVAKNDITAKTQLASAKKLYATYCLACHGSSMEGGSGSALIKGDWKYGGHRGALNKTIKYGVAGTDMIAYGRLLSD